MASRGFGVVYAGPEDFGKFMAKSDAELGATMKAVGIAKAREVQRRGLGPLLARSARARAGGRAGLSEDPRPAGRARRCSPACIATACASAACS